jgi:hypothetical protein
LTATPHWTAYLTPLIQLITALLAGYIAYKFGSIQASIARQQAATAATAAQTARNRLKFDLFERRMNMYSLVYDYIETVARTGKIEAETDSVFLNQVRSIGWVTDPTLVSYVFTELRQKMFELTTITGQLKLARESGEDQMNLLVSQVDAMQALRKQHPKLAEAFAPYLKLEH